MRTTPIRLVLAVIASGLAFLIILACSGSDTAAPQAVSGTVTSAPQPKHFKVGQQVKVDVWVITINSVKKSAGDDFDKPKNGQYLILDMTFKNTDNQSQTLSSLIQFEFQDSSGQKYTEQITALQGVSAPDGDVQAGSQTRGQVVYDVPTKEHAFTFTFTPGLSGDNAATWDISL